jgi:DNA topoisomerase-1
MKLVIVESPTKAKTLQKFLGSDYKIASSYGHLRDLPKSKLGIDIENNFDPQYIIMVKARKNLKELKTLVEKADEVLLATDPDREGEAISWHLLAALDLEKKNKPFKRVTFHEITKEAIQNAIDNPEELNLNLVDAQQARRVLDRLVGYKLSPFLWKKVVKGLSAGRVQSVAVRFIVEKEEEIRKFKPEEYWTIKALLEKEEKEFEASLIKKGKESIKKLDIKSKEESDNLLKELEGAKYIVEKVEEKETKKNPLPPFTTSSLQQTSWNRFKYSAKRTMSLAQNLYERGFITYHRSDSLNLSTLSLGLAEKYILSTYGDKYWSGNKFYKSKGNAQEAHEAIRPTDPNRTPESLEGTLEGPYVKMYELIWSRFLASQMNAAIFNQISADIKANDLTFRANGKTTKFDGFLKVYQTKTEEVELPNLKEQDSVNLVKLNPEQSFTKPPARFNEASLIKVMEENGIGRPSTYAAIISTIQLRNYVEKDDQKRFIPTETGEIVNKLLVEHFQKIVDPNFTAGLEESLDAIAEGKESWKEVIKNFYEPFQENLEKKEKEIDKKVVEPEKTDKKCPKCGSDIIIKFGRFGKFYACTNFPECKHTENLKDDNAPSVPCPNCKKGDIVKKRSKKGRVFYGCDNYPECKTALWDEPTEKQCEICNSIIVKTKRGLEKCSNKDCGKE